MTDPTHIPGDSASPPVRQQEIRHFLHHEHGRSSAVTLGTNWQTDAQEEVVAQLLQVMQGELPAHVYLAELPPSVHWTRKLKLLLPALPAREVTVIGAGTPRTLANSHVAYLLPIPAAKRTAVIHNQFLEGATLRTEQLIYPEVLGGLSEAASQHIQERMTNAVKLTTGSDAVPKMLVTGTLSMPGWNGAFLSYAARHNHGPLYFLGPEMRNRMFEGTRGLEIFQAGVRSLFRTLRRLNLREGGLFHGDLVHRTRRGSANLGFTADGAAIITGWGRRWDQDVAEWPNGEFHLQQMREVTGALAGLLADIMDSGITGEHRHHLLVYTVHAALEEYTSRRGSIDRVALAAGLPSHVDRLTRAARVELAELGVHERARQEALYEECGQLEEPIRRWLLQCVDDHL